LAKLTTEIVNQRLSSRGIELIGEYLNNRTKSSFKCLFGHRWITTPDSVMGGKGCPVCSGNLPLNAEIVNERIEARGLKLLGAYKNHQTKTLFKCANGHQWMAKPNFILGGGGCAICSGNSVLNRDAINLKLKGRGIELIGDYLNARTPTKFRCPKGHEWAGITDNILNKDSGCPHCSGIHVLSEELVNERLADRGISLIGSYKSVETKTKFRCLEGHEWMATPSNILRGRGCPSCTVFGTNNDALYIWKALGLTFNGTQVYKVGVTSARLSDTRIKHVARKASVEYEIVVLKEVAGGATETEAKLLRMGVNPLYEGFVGCTEFRAFSEPELLEALSIIAKAS